MVSYRNLFLVKAMTAWNALMGWTTGSMEWMGAWWGGVRSLFHPDAGSWLLYEESLFPVPFREWYGLKTAPWKYNPTTNRLTYQAAGSKEVYRVEWLSAQTIVGPRQTIVGPQKSTEKERIKDMDSFLGGLRIWTEEGVPLPLTVFLQAWSLYDKRWWLVEPHMKLEWIDADAEEHSVVPQGSVIVPLVRMGSRMECSEDKGCLKKN